MNKSIITEDLIHLVLQHIESETKFSKECVSYEIQDDFKHLLLSISIDDLANPEPTSTFKKVSELLNSLVPGRVGDYSWMVVFTQKGNVVDSYFGGDLNCPDAGL